EVVRSDNGGKLFTHEAFAIPVGDYKERANELGNLVIDHRNLPAGPGNFYAYQSFVAPSKSTGTHNNEAFLAVSADGGHTWTDRPIPCSVAPASTDLDHNFPDVSVDPAGNVWYAWSDDHTIRTAKSSNHGQTWSCSTPSVSTPTATAGRTSPSRTTARASAGPARTPAMPCRPRVRPSVSPTTESASSLPTT